MTGKADYKRMKLRIEPGDIPFHEKVAMLEGDAAVLGAMQTRLEACGMGIDMAKSARKYKKNFARKANRKIRHEAKRGLDA